MMENVNVYREEKDLKKKYLLLPVAAALLAAAAVGGTLAAGYAQSENVLQKVSEKSLGISIFSGDTDKGTSAKANVGIVPGATSRLKYQVGNDQKNGYDLYAKVTLYFDWASDALSEDEEKNHYVSLLLENQTFPRVESYDKQKKMGDWIVAYCDSREAVLYYTKPLSYGERASFLDAVSFSSAMGNRYADAQFLLDMQVDAVQTDNSREAIAAEWGVYPEITDGILTGISETR